MALTDLRPLAPSKLRTLQIDARAGSSNNFTLKMGTHGHVRSPFQLCEKEDQLTAGSSDCILRIVSRKKESFSIIVLAGYRLKYVDVLITTATGLDGIATV